MLKYHMGDLKPQQLSNAHKIHRCTHHSHHSKSLVAECKLLSLSREENELTTMEELQRRRQHLCHREQAPKGGHCALGHALLFCCCIPVQVGTNLVGQAGIFLQIPHRQTTARTQQSSGFASAVIHSQEHVFPFTDRTCSPLGRIQSLVRIFWDRWLHMHLLMRACAHLHASFFP
jgi:hypothetical protein